MNTAVKLSTNYDQAPAVLAPVKTLSSDEDPRLNAIYEALGWGDLPYVLKMTIAADVVGYYDELMGLYSTCDPGVLSRRHRVCYWVTNFREGACSLETALEVLHVKA